MPRRADTWWTRRVYREVHTGVELWERPQLTLLPDAIRRREVGVVIAYAIDRLARDPVHLGVIVSEAEHAGVEVCFVTELLRLQVRRDQRQGFGNAITPISQILVRKVETRSIVNLPSGRCGTSAG
jgi:DNA invertase Pin-like site-specific DNA recombinase